MRVSNMSDCSYPVHMNKPADTPRDFTPALPLLGAYDLIIATLTREATWRGALLQQVNPQATDIIADLGCGTASFLALLAKAEPQAKLTGIDPDERILKRARHKLGNAKVTLRQGFLHDATSVLAGSGVTKLVSSLVFHQVPLAEKRAGLAAMFAALPPGGELHIADYGLQRTRLMRAAFSIVQRVDGYEDTQPNADGVMPILMQEAGFARVEETRVIPTVTGSISLYRAIRAA